MRNVWTRCRQVDVAYVLDQLPSSVSAPRRGLPHWPQPQLSMAMVDTQVRRRPVQCFAK